MDTFGLPLGGSGTGNGNFTIGDWYGKVTLGEQDEHGLGAIFQIDIDKGSDALFVDSLLSQSWEHEFILPRNTIFEVTGYEERPITIYSSNEIVKVYKVKVVTK